MMNNDNRFDELLQNAAQQYNEPPAVVPRDEMWAAIAVELFTGDLQPKSQADIERAMKNWLGSMDIDFGDTAVRTRARQLWRKLEESQ